MTRKTTLESIAEGIVARRKELAEEDRRLRGALAALGYQEMPEPRPAPRAEPAARRPRQPKRRGQRRKVRLLAEAELVRAGTTGEGLTAPVIAARNGIASTSVNRALRRMEAEGLIHEVARHPDGNAIVWALVPEREVDVRGASGEGTIRTTTVSSLTEDEKRRVEAGELEIVGHTSAPAGVDAEG